MKKLKFLTATIFALQGAKAGSVSLGKLWSHIYQGLLNVNQTRQIPGINNGLFRFLVDTQNNNALINLSSIVQTIQTNDGKKYTAVFGYMPRKARQSENGTFDICADDGETLRMKYSDKKISNRFMSKKFKIPYEYVRSIKEGMQDYEDMVVAQALRTYLDALGREVSEYVIAKNYVGSFAKGGGSASKNLPLFAANGREINAQGEIQLMEDMMQAETNNIQPALIGGTALTAYAKMQNIATVNTTLGVDLSRLGLDNVMYRDTNIGIVPMGTEGTNTNRVLAIIPGALKLVTQVQNAGDFAYEDDTQMRGTTVDPFYGLTHDYYINVKTCKQEIEYTIQFGIDWDIIGYPDCWSDDEDFGGVTDVFAYNITFEDAGVDGMAKAEGYRGGLSEKVAEAADGYDACADDCSARFSSVCEELALFSVSALSAGSISAIRVNGMEFNTTGGVYDISTEAGADGLASDLRAVLNDTIGNVKMFSGGWESVGGDAEFYAIGTTDITSVVLVNDAGTDIELARTVNYFTNVKDESTVGGNYSAATLAWTAPSITFSGNPGDDILSSVSTSHYGLVDNFFALYSAAGDYTLNLTDENGCTDAFSDTTDVCDGLTFAVAVTAFDDADDDDTQDGGELGLQNIQLRMYEGIVQTELVDEIVTDANGLATFNVAPGTYNVDVVTTYGAAVGRTISTSRPKTLVVAVNGTITWGSQWNEDGLFPIGPA